MGLFFRGFRQFGISLGTGAGLVGRMEGGRDIGRMLYSARGVSVMEMARRLK